MAIAAAALITWLNYIGVKKAGEFQLVFTILKVVMIVGVGVVGFTAASGTWRNFGTHYAGAVGGIAGFMAALVAALWAYDGWNDLNMVSGEIRQPERTIPIALIAGVGIVAVLYMLNNAAVQYVLPADQIAMSQRPSSEATAIAVGVWGAAIVSLGMALSMLVTLNGTIMSGARIPYAMARDGYFFKAMADVHPRFHTPSVALIVQLVLSIVLLLFAGSFRQLFSLTIFCRVAVLHDRRQHGLRAAPQRAECAASVQDLGLPGGSRGLRAGGCGAAVLHLHGEPAEFDLGLRPDPVGDSDLRVLRTEAGAIVEGAVHKMGCQKKTLLFSSAGSSR